MASYITGVIVAMCMVSGLYLSLEMSTGNPVFQQDQLKSQTEEELRALAENFASPEQIEAILQLGNRPGDLSKTVPVLAKLATVRNELIKNAADSSLEAIGAPAAEHLKAFIEEDTTRGFRIACSGMRAIGPASKMYMEDIKRLLLEDDPILRKCGLYALQGMGEDAKAAMPEIIECVLDKDLNNQCSACRVLETFGTDAIDAEAALLRVQAEGGPSTRGWAAVCLGAIGPTSSDVDVAQLLADQLKPRSDGRPITPIEQERVLRGLAYLGPEATKVLDAVEEKMNGKNMYVRGYAAFAHWRITGKSDEAINTLKLLLDDPEVQGEGVYLLSKMGSEALPLLEKIAHGLRSSEPGEREMAVIAIGNMGSTANPFIDQIRDRLNDSDPLVRLAARRALKNIEVEEKKADDIKTETPANKDNTAEDKTDKADESR